MLSGMNYEHMAAALKRELANNTGLTLCIADDGGWAMEPPESRIPGQILRLSKRAYSAAELRAMVERLIAKPREMWPPIIQEDALARIAANSRGGSAAAARMTPKQRTERARAAAAARWDAIGEQICQYSESRATHNHDGRFTRTWRLYSSGLLTRTNSKSRYQRWIAGERIPAPILSAAQEHGVEIGAGRATGGGDEQ